MIAGRLGGRKLRAPVARGGARGVRPTSERVREALFSILGDVRDARVLDLYAGSGALGIEALSRGALHAVFVEAASPCVAALRANLKELGLEASARVVHADAVKAFHTLSGQPGFDLVFLDPPYASGELARALPALGEAGVLSADALVVVEGSRRHVLPSVPGFELFDQRRYGDTLVSWLQVRGPHRHGGSSSA